MIPRPSYPVPMIPRGPPPLRAGGAATSTNISPMLNCLLDNSPRLPSGLNVTKTVVPGGIRPFKLNFL